MNRHCDIRSVGCRVLAAMSLALVPLSAHADVARTGSEPWYQQSNPDDRERARALFVQARYQHKQLLRREAMELYEQALALWDNPDIRWNLALVLDDTGDYVRAHEQLEAALRWGAALGTERLREVQDQIRALETRRLARIYADSTEPGANVKLDGRPWFQGAGRHSILVLPGTHYIASTKPGYFPITVEMPVDAGEWYRVTLRMTADRLIETRRWEVWKPWSVFAAGIAAAAVGAGLEIEAFANRDRARAIADGCHTLACSPHFMTVYDRARTEDQIAFGAFAAGGIAVAVGLALAWLNQPHAHRTEAVSSPVEFIPTVSRSEADLSALFRF